MDRRSFLKGTFGGVVAGGVIVVATDADIKAFATNLPPDSVVQTAVTGPATPMPELGHIVFDSEHRPLGVISRTDVSCEKLDATPFGSPYRLYRAGPYTMEFTVQAYGPFNIRFNSAH